MTPAEMATLARVRVLIPKGRSGNRKTGRIYATITDSGTCPPQCVFRRNGCYADAWPLRLHWDRAPSEGVLWHEFLGWVENLPSEVWRHNQAGDLPNVGGRLIREAVIGLADANKGRPCILYTHAPVTGDGETASHNRTVIREAYDRGLVITASVDRPGLLDRPAEHALPSLAVVLPHGGRAEPDLTVVPKTQVTANGMRVVRCPATYRDTDCKACGLCARARDYAIGFPVHGNAVRKAQTASEGSGVR